jgi:serine protease Do
VALPPENPPRDTQTINGRNPLGGAKVANLSPAAALDFGLDQFSKGVVVVEVADNSYAAAQGFQTGDIIRSVNGADINRVGDLARALNAGNRWNIAMERGGRRLVLDFAD